MNLLVVGNGGREHIIGTLLRKNKEVKHLYFAPGNGGTALIGQNIDIQVDEIKELSDFAIKNHIDFTIVGPEEPLSRGIVDIFLEKGLKIFGPTKQATQLESSKIFAKNFMIKYGIPTAKYDVFTDQALALEALTSYHYPIVIKADGLAAGKGVIICDTKEIAQKTVTELMEHEKFGMAGKRIIIEEFLQGKEASVLCFIDGKTVEMMPSAQDYKKINDGDEGLNTGGMGAICEALYYTKSVEQQTKQQIIDRTIYGLHQEQIDFRGVLYFGIMITKEGPKLLEYNTRFGDPETEALLLKLETDLLQLCLAVTRQQLQQINVQWSNDFSMCVVITSKGYPERYKINEKIDSLPQQTEDVFIFHSGTKKVEDVFFTTGGRVIVVSGIGKDPAAVRAKVYKIVEKILFSGAYYRRDIGGEIR